MFSAKKPLTTASSSIGFKLHVLYKISPPGFRYLNPFYKSSSWILWKVKAALLFQNFRWAWFFRKVPSPEQGTSARTFSKKFRKGSVFASWFAMRILGQSFFNVCPPSIKALFLHNSFAKINPGYLKTSNFDFRIFPITISIIYYVFDPGAAHISRILSPC